MRNAFYCEGPAWLCKGQRFCCENNEASVSSYVWHSALGIEIMTIIIIKTMKVIIMQRNVMQHNDDNNNYNDNYINDHNDINDNSIQLKSRPNIYIYIYIYTYIYIHIFFYFYFLERWHQPFMKATLTMKRKFDAKAALTRFSHGLSHSSVKLSWEIRDCAFKTIFVKVDCRLA